MPPKRKASARLAADQDSQSATDVNPNQISAADDSQGSILSNNAEDQDDATPPKAKRARKRVSAGRPPADSQASVTTQDSQSSEPGLQDSQTFDSQASLAGVNASLLAHIPTNTQLPAEISATEVPNGHIKIVTWNVGGLNAAMKKGLDRYVSAESPDILCLQETKLSADPDPSTSPFLATYPFRYFHHCRSRKGYSGTAVLSKIEPVSITLGFPANNNQDDEGRVITLEFPGFYLVATYVLNAGQGLKRLQDKLEWNVKLREYIQGLDARKPVVWCGDLNVAHQEGDLARPKTNAKTAGFTPDERADFTTTLTALSMCDVWRHQHPDPFQKFTYFSYRFQCRSKRIGWRLDYFVTSERLVPVSSAADVESRENAVDAGKTARGVRVGPCTIRDDVYGVSDHVPVVLTLKMRESTVEGGGTVGDDGSADGSEA